MVGSILDAHPNAVVANEFDVLKHLRRRTFTNRLQLYRLLVDNSIDYASNSRVQAGYSYAIPGAHQGRWIDDRLLAIGDKKGGGTSAFLSRSFQLTIEELQRLQSLLNGLPLAFFHVARNPYDNIATMISWKNQDTFKSGVLVDWQDEFNDVFERFAQLAIVNRKFMDFIGACQKQHQQHSNSMLSNCIDAIVIDVDGRQLLANAGAELRRWCELLQLNVDARWLNASISILYDSPSDTRNQIRWPKANVERLLISFVFAFVFELLCLWFRIQRLFSNWTLPKFIVG